MFLGGLNTNAQETVDDITSNFAQAVSGYCANCWSSQRACSLLRTPTQHLDHSSMMNILYSVYPVGSSSPAGVEGITGAGTSFQGLLSLMSPIQSSW